MTKLRNILIVEDEHTLRQSMVRGLSKLAGVEIVDAGTTRDAKRLLSLRAPDLVISDLDLPDGSGIEVAAEADRLGHRVPIVFVSAFLGRYKSRIPTRADVEVYEKPLALERLRAIVEDKLGLDDDGASPSPFGVADYVQLAGMGRHSVLIEVRSATGRGRIVIHRGELWNATDSLGGGMEAFRRLAFLQTAQVTCRTLRQEDLPPRDVDGSAESVLLDAARSLDEHARHAPAAAPRANVDESWDDVFAEERKRTPPPPPPPPSSRASVRPPRLSTRAPAPNTLRAAEPPRVTIALSPAAIARRFEEAFDRGVDALLAKDYPRAYAAFVEASELSPEDRRVVANLARLKAMGYA